MDPTALCLGIFLGFVATLAASLAWLRPQANEAPSTPPSPSIALDPGQACVVQCPDVAEELGKLDSSSYRLFHQFQLPRLNGNGKTLIHHVAVSRFGVFVIHVKEESGKIHGTDEQYHWRLREAESDQHLINPLLRCAYHCRCLARQLELDEAMLLPLVYFPRSCQFSNPHASNLITESLALNIGLHQSVLMNDDELARVCARLQETATPAPPPIIREGNWLSSARILAMHDPMKVRRLQRGAPVDSSETSAKVF